MSLDKKILNRIKEENIKIKPRWMFALKDFSFELLAAILIAVGSVSVGLIINFIAKSQGKFSVFSFPYFWIIILAISLLGIYKSLMKAELFYKFRFAFVAITIVLVNSLFGLFVFASGSAEKIEEKLEEIPAYGKILPITVEKYTEETKSKQDEYESGKTKKNNNNNKKESEKDNDKKSENEDEEDEYGESDGVILSEGDSMEDGAGKEEYDEYDKDKKDEYDEDNEDGYNEEEDKHNKNEEKDDKDDYNKDKKYGENEKNRNGDKNEGENSDEYDDEEN